MSTPRDAMHWRVAELESWRRHIDERVQPEVLAERVNDLRDEVRAMKRALWGFVFAVLTAAVVFSLTVLSRSGAI